MELYFFIYWLINCALLKSVFRTSSLIGCIVYRQAMVMRSNTWKGNDMQFCEWQEGRMENSIIWFDYCKKFEYIYTLMALKRERFYFKFEFVVVIIPKAPRCLWEGTTMADGLGMLRRYDSVSVGPDVQGPLGNQQWSWLVWRDGYIFPFILESRIVSGQIIATSHDLTPMVV